MANNSIGSYCLGISCLCGGRLHAMRGRVCLGSGWLAGEEVGAAEGVDVGEWVAGEDL
jgi:hypothetical protein